MIETWRSAMEHYRGQLSRASGWTEPARTVVETNCQYGYQDALNALLHELGLR